METSLTRVLISELAVILTIALAIPATFFANAQVNVEQSQSSNINGVQSSMQSDSNNGKTVVQTAHGKLILEGDHIKYCVERTCGPTYTLSDNGTIKFP